jgi:hypothetical protein
MALARFIGVSAIACAGLVAGTTSAHTQTPTPAPALNQIATAPAPSADDAGKRLLAAYPDHVEGAANGMLLLRDGTRLPLDDGRGAKPTADWLASPDLKDIFRFRYPAGAPATPPAPDVDPGRARPAAFFNTMYGDCRKGEVARHLVDVAWLPSRGRQTVKATTINGVAQKLMAVSAELDALPPKFTAFLAPSAGTYNCRAIASTAQASSHSYGIAIDIALKHAHYWRWSKAGAERAPAWRNAIPDEIVRIFEKHGFIWGGRWHHFDTMHFEYRPELLIP